MAKHHHLIFGRIVHQFEVIAGLPVVALLPNEHAWVLTLINLDDFVVELVVVLTVGAQETGEHVHLVVVLCQIVAKIDSAGRKRESRVVTKYVLRLSAASKYHSESLSKSDGGGCGGMPCKRYPRYP